MVLYISRGDFMDNYQKLWNDILKVLNDELGDNTFKEIFKDCTDIHKFENNYLMKKNLKFKILQQNE